MNPQLSQTGTRLQAVDLRPHPPVAAEAAAAGGKPASAIRLLHQASVIARAIAARCERQYFAALRNHSPSLAAAALEHANAARVHEERLAARLADLGGSAAAPPGAALPCIASEAPDGNSLPAVIAAYLVAGRGTIESYREIAGAMESCDRTTQELLDGIIASEEKRASNLAGLLEVVSSPRVW